MKAIIIVGILLHVSLMIKCERPNIVIIMADDLGYNDISLHGSEIPTPNIDALGMHGIILNRFYTPPMCTPSRASLFTGKYPSHVGMQHFVIDSDEPWGMDPNDKIMPEFFQEAGYNTHLVGKWHLGFFKKEYTPNQRGFDSFFGYLGPYIGYFNHMLHKFERTNYTEGYDMRRNYTVSYETNGTYATELFTNMAVKAINDHDTKGKPLFLMLNHLAPHAANSDKPLEAPKSKLKQFRYILDEQRRYLAAMVSVIDDGVGEVIQALQSKGMLDNTIVLFYSDNGAPTVGLHTNKGSNYPLRGQKNSPWEGGSRVSAVLWHSSLPNRRVYDRFMHVSDLLPTLATATGVNLGPFLSRMDGVDQWDALKSLNTSDGLEVRKSMLYNFDDVSGYSAYMEEGWKVVEGTTLKGIYDYWMGDFTEPAEKMNNTFYAKLVQESLVHQTMPDNAWLNFDQILERQKASEVDCRLDFNHETECDPLVKPCLFNLLDDPCEYNNLADQNSSILNRLLSKLKEYRDTALPTRNQGPDYNANPIFYNNTWTYWQEMDEKPPHAKNYPELPMLLVLSVSGIVLLVIFYSIITQLRKKSVDQPTIPKISSINVDGNCNNNNKETTLNIINNSGSNAIETDKIHL